jgi:hypothetical protein
MIPAKVNAQDYCDANTMPILVPDTVHFEDIGLDVNFKRTYAKEQLANLTISFVNSQTGNVQKNINFSLAIKDSDDREIFNTTKLIGKPSHTNEGVIVLSEIPFEELEEGYYTFIVAVHGIGSNPSIPLNPHVASFPCVRVPEFPMVVLGAIAATMTAMAIVLTRYKKLAN